MHRHRYIEAEGESVSAETQVRLRWGIAVAGVLVLLTAGIAGAASVRVLAGNLVVDLGAGIAPKKLPRGHRAPIKAWGFSRLATRDRSTPPTLKSFTAEFDNSVRVETRRLPKCSLRKLRDTTTRQARRQCPGAIVGTGHARAIVDFPDQAPIPAGSPLTVFNGPKIKGSPSAIIHAYLTVPVPTAYVFPVRIQRIHKGAYGIRATATIPRIAGGFGSPVFGSLKFDRRWYIRGRKLSYLYASCPRGRLQARVETSFRDGTVLHGAIVNPCQVRKHHLGRSRPRTTQR